MKITKISVDDGAQADVKVAELASKYGVNCIFYWPVELVTLGLDLNYTPLNHDDAKIISKEFEIGSHGITHRYLTRIPYAEAVNEIFDSKEILESKFNKEIKSFCFPRGYANEELVKAVQDAGYTDYRLTIGKDSEGSELVHVHPKSGVNGKEYWTEKLQDGDYHLWMHSYDLDRYDLWDDLERVLRENSLSQLPA